MVTREDDAKKVFPVIMRRAMLHHFCITGNDG